MYLEDLLSCTDLGCSGEEPLEPYSRHDFSIHAFKDERTLSRKIRLAVNSRDTLCDSHWHEVCEGIQVNQANKEGSPYSG